VERKALRMATGARLVRIVIEDLGVTLHAAYSADYSRLYLVIPGEYCSCPSYLFEVFLRRAAEKCVHLEAFELSSNVREVRVSYEEFRKRIYPLLFKGLL